MQTTTLVALGSLAAAGVLGWVLLRSDARSEPPDRVFEVPGGGTVTLPGRFVPAHPETDDPVARAFVPDDLLLVVGKRRWSMGGHPDVSEALAVGPTSTFPDGDEFRRRAAHFLGDAEWRGPAREPLSWEEEERDGLVLRWAELPEVPDRWLILASKEGVRAWAVAFVKDSRREGGLEAVRRALESYRAGDASPAG